MLSSHVAAYRIRFTFAMANVESDSMRLFEVTFRVCVLPDGYWYTAQIITGAEDEKSAKEEARKWFQAKQPYHKSDEDRLVATLDNFQSRRVGNVSLLWRGRQTKPMENSTITKRDF